jgi:hypothetical protein
MTEVISFWLDVNHNFPNKEILTMHVAKEAKFVVSVSYAHEVTFGTSSAPVTGSVSLPISPSIGDGSSALRAFAKEMSLLTSTIL